jgi:hypothetical protein
MTTISPNEDELLLVAPQLIIPSEIVARLPESVVTELAQLPAAKQAEFLQAFRNQSRSLAFAYLVSLIYCHYGLLGRWAMSGMMWVSLFVTATLGSVWWLIDLVRLPAMVRTHNQRVAADILRKLNAAAGDPTPLAGSGGPAGPALV